MPERRSTFQSSGFFFDVEKFFGSVSASRMSFAEKGVYLVMMFQEWRAREKSLPDDPQAVADLIAVTEAQVAEVLAAWPVVRRKFAVCERDADKGRMFNVALERTRRAQAQYKRNRSESGRKGGLARGRNSTQSRGISPKHSLSSAEAKPSDLNRVDMNRDDLSRSDQTHSFDRFWLAYPKKVGKDDARRAWDKRRPGAELTRDILDALERQRDWLNRDGGKYTPNPATWLNQGRWQDEPPDTAGLSETARYNLAASEKAGELIELAEQERTRAKRG